ncbi:exopolysaccharide biosynthesis polyprenyl glycosylphosphotransferase [Devosia sp.]|uniref:exopolysaccharide biosynthesis polyprenyl glycosylphosphotransferase n=1 Tax=Devosia sp. TaxID=1871048 RepID=UPI003A9511B3
MAQENIGQRVQVERRSARRVNSNLQTLSTMLGVGEGLLAGLTMLLPALAYHVVLLDVPLSQVNLVLYGSYALVTSLLYGSFSGISAKRYLGQAKADKVDVPFSESLLSWTGAFSIALFAAFLLGISGDLSRVSMLTAFVIGVPVLLMGRGFAYSALGLRIRTGRLQYQRVAVIGSKDDVQRFLRAGSLWRAGYQLAGTLNVDHARNSADEILEFAARNVAQGAQYVVLVGDMGDVDGLNAIANKLKRFSVNAVCVPATDNDTFKFLDVVPLGPNNAVRFLRKPMSDGAVALKRSFDLVLAGLGVLVLSPLFAVIAILIKLEGPGAVFYRQERRGFNGETFRIWKFRSMRVTESGHKMTQAQVGDPRITRIGAFIRRTSIDELPQLFNVLSGEMSLVGPRPHALVHDDELGTQVATYAHRQRIKPGITGWAQVNGYRGETSTIEQINGRTSHDLFYVDNWSIFFDFWIIVLTVFSPKTRQNAV